jgi:hypothetical protein
MIDPVRVGRHPVCLVSVDFPDGPWRGFDSLVAAANTTDAYRLNPLAHAPVRSPSKYRKSIVGSVRGLSLGFVIIGSCTAGSIAADVATELSGPGVRACAVVVDHEVLDEVGLAREWGRLLDELSRNGAETAAPSRPKRPLRLSETQLVEWLWQAHDSLQAAGSANPTLREIPRGVLDQLLKRYDAWLVHCATAAFTSTKRPRCAVLYCRASDAHTTLAVAIAAVSGRSA